MFRRSNIEMRVLILAPVGRDADLLAQTLQTIDVQSAIVPSIDTLIDEISLGMGASIIADEAISPERVHELASWLSTQPPWSDPPFIILTPGGRSELYSHERAQQFSTLGNFTLIERPMRPEIIQSAVRAALRGRMKQYEIRSRQEDLLRANTDLEQFAHSASHDLKEPLRNIRIFNELLSKEYGHTLDQRGASFLEMVGTSALRMENLLGDLLAYTQTSSIPDERAELADSRAALDAALGNLHAALQEANAELIVEDLPAVRMRESHLQQLFQNLVGNALKYRRDGCRPRVSIASSRYGEFWLYSIADNGIGIAPEHREKVFGIFQRLHT
ncbi:MAG TPA: ATP-binding protein, partial [Bryobacteraceae bacterium]|nr:ATP-binding protein [Bryobacteraceae bacterium]